VFDEQAYNSLPHVVSMGPMLFDPIWAEQTHASGCCELLQVIHGTLQLELGGRRFAGQPGDLLLVPQDTPHRDRFELGEGLQVFMVMFTWEGAADYFSRVTNDQLLGLPRRRKAEIVRELERLRYDALGEVGADRLLARARLAAILLHILREAVRSSGEREETSSHQRRARRRAIMLAARGYLAEHYAHPISLEEIAQALNISTFYLSHVFSQESEFSLFAYLTALRMQKARELLQAGEMNVSEVAAAVGYESSNYFSKVFRKHFGQPPSAFRR
jgi:AraC-like DNA-binding protein